MDLNDVMKVNNLLLIVNCCELTFWCDFDVVSCVLGSHFQRNWRWRSAVDPGTSSAVNHIATRSRWAGSRGTCSRPQKPSPKPSSAGPRSKSGSPRRERSSKYSRSPNALGSISRWIASICSRTCRRSSGHLHFTLTPRTPHLCHGMCPGRLWSSLNLVIHFDMQMFALHACVEIGEWKLCTLCDLF